MKKIEIVIPCIPPSVNSAFMYLRHGRVLTKKYREFRDLVEKIVGDVKMPWEFCTVSIDLRPPDRRRRDVDNYTKALFDSLTSSGIWEDDSQVREMKVRFIKPEKKANAYTIVTIKEKENEYDRARSGKKEASSGIYCM